MFKNYLKSAWRSLAKNKTFSFINIAGLSIGMAACILILQYVSFELSFDQFHKNVNDIYRVYNDRYQNGKLIQHGTITYSAIGKAMKDDFPEVAEYVRVVPMSAVIIKYNNKKVEETNQLAVESNFLTMFNFPLLAGDPETALKEPNTAVISENLAKKIFEWRSSDYRPLVGKLVVLGTDSFPYIITGVCKNVPENSHLQFNLLISYPTLYATYKWKEAEYDFTDSDFWHYLRLRHGTNYKALQAKFPEFSKRHFQGNKVSGSYEKFYLQPLSRAHLYSDFEYEIGKTDSATVVWGMLIIAILIIGIAWVNYVNLATAKSMDRAREVGIRKVSGATKHQLIRQFLTESLIINLLALVIATVLVFVSQRGFNNLTGHQLSTEYLIQKGLSGFNILASLLILIVAGIFISGFYPAFVLSSFRPILVLKGKFTNTGKGIALRKVLVVGQFAITVALMIGSFVVYKQIKFVNNQNLGINISQVLVLKPPKLTQWDSTFIAREDNFKHELSQIPNILGAANSWNVAGDELGRNFDVHRTDLPSGIHFTSRFNGISDEFTDVYGIKLLAGRKFRNTDYNPNFDKLHNIIINETVVKMLGFKSSQDAVGKQISRGTKNWDIVGVLSNFHQKSLRFPIEPSIFYPAYSTYSPISVKVVPNNISSTIAAIRKKYDAFFPGNLFDYYFLDEKFNEQYANDRLFGKIFGLFSAFAIFIACLGLLGLSLYATAQRTKEIGVRKVLGASVTNIVILLSRDFIKLVIISFLIASPVAWLIMNNWLGDFAYRINISWWIFAAAGIVAILVAFGTISFEAIKAAVANPVKSLRTE